MRIPNADRAVVDLEKLTEYCLNPSHPRGRHKARVFESALGLTLFHAEVLRGALFDAASEIDPVEGERDEFGQRYVMEFEMTGPAGTAMVRSAWIIRTDEGFPRLVTCHVI
ncbi:MAG: DUF6883 domain-containing protein [Planctomycetales bacterium]